MRKLGLGILIGIVVLALSGVAVAISNQGAEKAKVPPQLPESELTKIVFIRYAPGFPKINPAKPVCGDDIAHPSEQCGEPGLPECPAGSVCINCKCVVEEEVEPTACYGFLSGAQPRWNWVEGYVYNNENLAVPSSGAVITWEAPVSGDIFGVGSYALGYDWGVYDYKNSVSFEDYSKEGVIAVTAIWFRAKNIYEYDIMFDMDYFPGTGAVDLDTVALHEFGHGAGLDDLYDWTCSDNVMFGYYIGEKTTLGSGDTIGIQTLYGI